MDRGKHPALLSPQLLGDVWREACRHLSLPEALAAIEARLRDALPAGRFFVLDLDSVRQLESLRATAEADRQSLLARLGRDTLTDTVDGRFSAKAAVGTLSPKAPCA